MALSGVHELSSILRTEDSEKSELNRKKLSIELAIKQQEGRLVYEVEERDRCIHDIFAANGSLEDNISIFELKELTLQEMDKEIDSGFSKIYAASMDPFLKQKSTLLSTVHEMSQKLNYAIDTIERVEEFKTRGLSKVTADHKLHLEKLNTECTVLVDNTSESLALRTRKEMELEELDVRAADISTESDKIARHLCTVDQELTRRHEALKCLQEKVDARRSEIAKDDFANSAHLGKRVESLSMLKDKLAEENKIISSIEKESSQLGAAVHDYVTQGESLASRISTAQYDLEKCRKDTKTLQSTHTILQQTGTGLLSELATVKAMRETTVLQSFKPRADALAEELMGVVHCNQLVEESIATITDQLRDNSKHEDLRDLVEKVRLTNLKRSAAKEQRNSLSKTLDALLSSGPPLERAIAEQKSKLELIGTRQAQVRDSLKTLQDSLHELNKAREGSVDAEDLQLRIAALESEQHDALVEAEKMTLLAQETQHSILERKQELEQMRAATAERDQAAVTRVLAKEKKKRLTAAKEGIISAHRQNVSKLRRLLMEEDKLFQQTQQRERTEHEAALTVLDEEHISLNAQILRKKEELAVLQRSLEFFPTIAPLTGGSPCHIAPAGAHTNNSALSQRELSQQGQQSQHLAVVPSQLQSVPATSDPPNAQEGTEEAFTENATAGSRSKVKRSAPAVGSECAEAIDKPVKRRTSTIKKKK